MKKKLWQTFGPLLVACCLLVILYLIPWKLMVHDKKTIQSAAISLDANVLRGNSIKAQALEENYVPFFGSSELSRFSPFHPSVLAAHYKRNYKPFLMGAAGTQSLNQYLWLSDLPFKNKKAVFFISPQWFVKQGVRKQNFEYFYSPLQMYSYLLNMKEVTAKDKYLATRLLGFKKLVDDTKLKTALKEVASGNLPDGTTKAKLFSEERLYDVEDELFSGRVLLNTNKSFLSRKYGRNYLPQKYDRKKLDKLAYTMGQAQTQNNPFEISNVYFNQQIAPKFQRLKGSQKKNSFIQSPEYADFQLILENFANNNIDCLFIIPPVNKRWTDFTGLSQPMLQQFATKIKHQLTEQGFTNVVDLNSYANENFFMEDTIHLGWRGWVEVDETIAPFLSTPKEESSSYHLSANYFSTKWQNYIPEK